jgi:hypothetical protein
MCSVLKLEVHVQTWPGYADAKLMIHLDYAIFNNEALLQKLQPVIGIVQQVSPIQLPRQVT